MGPFLTSPVVFCARAEQLDMHVESGLSACQSPPLLGIISVRGPCTQQPHRRFVDHGRIEPHRMATSKNHGFSVSRTWSWIVRGDAVTFWKRALVDKLAAATLASRELDPPYLEANSFVQVIALCAKRFWTRPSPVHKRTGIIWKCRPFLLSTAADNG